MELQLWLRFGLALMSEYPGIVCNRSSEAKLTIFNSIDLGVQKNLDRESYLSNVMDTYRQKIEEIRSHGISNIVLMNAGNITRTPSVIEAYANNYTRLRQHALMNAEFNKKLKAMYESLKAEHNDVSSLR